MTFHTGEGDQDYWECSCTLRNPLPLTTCEACGLERGGHRSLEPWVCSACTYHNDASRAVCEVCQHPGPNSSPEERPPAPQSAPEALIEPEFNPNLAALMFSDNGSSGGGNGSVGGGGGSEWQQRGNAANPFAAMFSNQDLGWDCPRCRTRNIPNSIQCKQCRLQHLPEGQPTCVIS